MKEYKLTPKQILEMDEISVSKSAAKKTLEVAINYHTNQGITLCKKEKAWWDDMKEVYNLCENKQYKVDSSGAFVVIKEIVD